MPPIPVPDRRKEARTEVNLALTVWGVDTRGGGFLQEAHAHDVSLSGAMLSGLDADVKPGDIIGILYASRKARFRVVWVRYDGAGDGMQAAVHRISADECPWLDLVGELRATESNAASAEIFNF